MLFNFHGALDTIQSADLVRGSRRAWSRLEFVYANKDESAEIGKKQFPTMPLEDSRRRSTARSPTTLEQDGQIATRHGYRESGCYGAQVSQVRRQIR